MDISGSKQGRIEFAHNLRGIAALFVVITHLGLLYWHSGKVVTLYTGIAPYSGTLPLISRLLSKIPLINFGALGVSIFFLISGFVIPFALEKQTRLQFLIGRIFRIWPTYVAGLTITLVALAIASWYFKVEFVPTLHSIIACLLISPSLLGQPSIDGIIWTLELELKFYLLIALVPQLTKGKVWLLLTTALLFCVMNFLMQDTSSLLFYGIKITLPFLIFMLIGILFNNCYREKINKQQLYAGSIILLILFRLANHYAENATNFDNHLIASYIIGLLIFNLCFGQRYSIKFPKFFNYLADISYPLYCCHAILGYVFISIFLSHYHQPTIALLLAISIALIFATLIHKFIELPTSEYGRRLGARIAARQFQCRSRRDVCKLSHFD